MKKKRRRRKRRAGWLAEFSKRVIAALTLMWFFGAFVGVGAVIFQLRRGDYAVPLADLLTYIGAPMTGGLLGYFIKAAVENREKIRRGAEASQTKQGDFPRNIDEV